MDKNNIHKDFLNNADLPVSIPPADEAWNDMRKKLEPKKRRFAFWLFLFVLTGIFISSTWVIYHTSVLYKKDTVSQLIYKENKNDSIKNKSGKNNLLQSSVDENEMHNSKKKLLSIKQSFGNKKELVNKNGQDENTFLRPYIAGNNPDSSGKNILIKTDSVVINQTQAFNQPKIANTNKKYKNNFKDSSDATSDDSSDLTIETGIEWFAPLAFNNSSDYFAAPDTKSKAYRILLPGIWMNFVAKKSMFKLNINPFTSALLPQKPFAVLPTETQNGDTIFSKSQVKTLNKIFGFSAGLGYSYNIKGNWWLGGNFQGIWWNKAIYTENNNTVKKSVSNSFNDIHIDSPKKYVLNNTDWNNFSSFQANLNIELLYRKNLWQAGFNAGLPLSPLSKNMGPTNTFNAQLFFRLKLWERNKKKND